MIYIYISKRQSDFAYAKFRENKTLAKIYEFTVQYVSQYIGSLVQLYLQAQIMRKCLQKLHLFSVLQLLIPFANYLS